MKSSRIFFFILYECMEAKNLKKRILFLLSSLPLFFENSFISMRIFLLKTAEYLVNLFFTV